MEKAKKAKKPKKAKTVKATESIKYQELIKELIAVRKNKELSQADIADKFNKPQSFVSKYENYERRIDVVEFIDVCRTIGVNPVAVMLQAGLINRDDLEV